MTGEQVLSYVNKKGIILTPDGNLIEYKAPKGIMTSDLVEMIRIHKRDLLDILNADRQIRSISPYLSAEEDQYFSPADCDSCPAGGFWEFKGSGMWCFHSAYFLGRPSQPVRCKTARQDCPLQRNGS